MNKYGSDKGGGHHNYTSVIYEDLFNPIRNQPLNLLEIGIGTIRHDIPSSMIGTPGGYSPGSSLRGWKEFFPNGQVHGCDIDDTILFNEDRLSTFYLDQTSEESIQTQIIDKNIRYDVIIDDGLHDFKVNWAVLKQLYPVLKSPGIYIIEDIGDFDSNLFYNDPFYTHLMNNGVYCQYLQIDNPSNTSDNNIVLLRKK